MTTPDAVYWADCPEGDKRLIGDFPGRVTVLFVEHMRQFHPELALDAVPVHHTGDTTDALDTAVTTELAQSVFLIAQGILESAGIDAGYLDWYTLVTG